MTGKWHYGDSAAIECARTSNITEISGESGITRKVTPPPPSESDLKQREQELALEAAAKKQAANQIKQDQLLLATYAHESDLLYIRDRKLAQIEANTKASEETLKSLQAALTRAETQAAQEEKGGALSPETTKALEQSRAQTARHAAAIAAMRQELDATRMRYDAELERFRKLKQGTRATKSASTQ